MTMPGIRASVLYRGRRVPRDRGAHRAQRRAERPDPRGRRHRAPVRARRWRRDRLHLPRGPRLDPGENFPQAALREVHEETGLACRIERFVGTTNYTHRKGKPKIVAYYLMAVDQGSFAPTEEVDDLVWLALEHVRDHLTWARDKELFDLALEMPELLARAS
jgi:8-oxo-(d)GTP phosphatase